MNYFKTIDGNEAAVNVAYRLVEVAAIYPITPSSSMGELAEQWAYEEKKNIWGTIPKIAEMQSEGGAAGAVHGALQTGALTTTFTASQGLLLMIPNMYKIAGELLPCVIHVAARSLAAQALSIFGDHSDVMAARSTGFAMLCAANVQESHDMSLVAHAATLESRLPFMHFFDGFRTSHEISKISIIPDETLGEMIDDEWIFAHRNRALSPDHPVLRGSTQNPDVYFQGRESVNTFYNELPEIVQATMDKLGKLTGRSYKIYDYYGDADAEDLIVMMGSGCDTVKETLDYFKKTGRKAGLLQVRLFRPFDMERLVAEIPSTVKRIAVLDRTKEPGAAGEPLLQDVSTALLDAWQNKTLATMPKIIGGRYGLSSKEFTPAMVIAIYDELLKEKSLPRFTVGIEDDVTHLSLKYDQTFNIEDQDVYRALFYGLGADGTVGANKNTIKIIGEETDFQVQGYFVYDSKKSGSRTVSHLRFSKNPIRSTYLISSANFIACHQSQFVEQVDLLKYASEGSTFLLNTPLSVDEVWDDLPLEMQKTIIAKNMKFFVIDAATIAQKTGMGSRINTIMQTCFFALSGFIPRDEAISQIKKSIEKTYSRKGQEVVNKNFAAVDYTLENLFEVNVPATTSSTHSLPPVVSEKAPDFVKNVLAMILSDRGDELPVSAIPIDGTYPTGTSKWEKRNTSPSIAVWEPDTCIQCGACSMICPHAAIRTKSYPEGALAGAPEHFKHTALKGKGGEGSQYTLQVYLEDCTGCNLCAEVCPVVDKNNNDFRAINMAPKAPILEAEKASIEYFEQLPTNARHEVDASRVKGAQYLEPLFEFSGACSGCGETPYIRLITQLFGERMLVANATGCSSIFGGNLPTTPYTTNADGRGPAWANSLFEDNAEFGFGYQLTMEKHKEAVFELIESFKEELPEDLYKGLLHSKQDDELEIIAQRERINELKEILEGNTSSKAKHLLSLVDHLVDRSVWIFGGDGWAYDIGFGGLDHVMASGKNVNILVLDTETYSNTGGQASKSTPRAATAKFASGGKPTAKKDLALMAISYGNVYVAKVSVGANPAHAIKALREAEQYDGPSLIIGYGHCISHGINMNDGIDQQKKAVQSGYWPLFRYNPEDNDKGINPMHLDSRPPKISLKDYALNELRYNKVFKENPEMAEELLKLAQDDVNRNWLVYENLANGKSPSEAVSPIDNP